MYWICSVWIELKWGETCLATGKVHYHSQIQMGQTQNLISKSFQYQRERIRCEHSVLNPPLWLWSWVKSKIKRGLFYSSNLNTAKFCFHQIELQEVRNCMWICHCYVWRQAWNLTLILPQNQTLNCTSNYYRFESDFLILPESMAHKSVYLNNNLFLVLECTRLCLMANTCKTPPYVGMLYVMHIC